MSPMEADLRVRIRRLLDLGVLPARSEEQKLYGGQGAGQLCDCCGGAISGSEVVYEVESPERAPLAMHLRCFDAWEVESLSARRRAGKASPGLSCVI